MPTRYLKPGIRDSELIDGLSPMAEVMFYRLLVTVDDFGRFDARPSMLKSQCFPIKDKITPKNCQEYLQELVAAGLVLAYTADGKPFLQVLRWDNVPRSKESKFPAPADGCAHTYTDVNIPRTVLPVTVTVTETETETKTETGTETKTGNRATLVATPDGVSESVWSDFLKVRKAKKSPMTETALEGISREAEKAGWSLEDAIRECASRGWVGFKAEWVNKPAPMARGTLESFRERDARLAAERMAEFAPGVAARPRKPIFDLEVQNANVIEGNRQIV